jgi:hypothetical protein
MTAYNNTSKYRLRPVLSLLIAVMFSMAGIGLVGICIAAETDCEKLLSKEAYKSLSTEKIKQIQDSLNATGFDPREIDGVIGPHTQAALKQFCVEFENEFRKDSLDDFIAILFLYAAIAKDYPEWKKIVLNNDFELWIDQQPAEKRAVYHKIMRSGTAKDIISLFEQYQSDLKKSTEETQRSEFGKIEKYVVSYKLTEKDLEQLKSEKNIAAKLKELIEKDKDKSFDSKEDFITAVQNAVRLQEDELNLVIENAQQDNYTLTEKSFETLKEKIPESVVDGLNKLKDKKAQAEDEIKTEVGAIIDEAIQFDQYQPMFLKYAKVEGPYRISKEYLEKLKKKNVPDYVIAKLETLPKEPYADINAFKKTVRPIIEDVTKKDNFPDPVVSEFVSLQDEDLEKQRKGADKIIQKERENYIIYQKIIIQEIDELPLFKLTAQSEKKLENAGVPDYLIIKLNELEGNGYTDEYSFKNALNKKIEELSKGYQAAIVDHAEKITTYQLTESAFEELEEKLKANAIPDAEMLKLQSLQDTEYPDKALFTNALEENTSVPSQKRLSIVKKAEKKHALIASTDKPFEWNAGSCGCLLDDLSGVVYGFYPFWLAGDQDDQKKEEKAGDQNGEKAENQNKQKKDDKIIQHEFDFSVLSRIGFYALSFDENGDFYEQLPWAWKPKGKLLPWQKTAAEKKAEKAAKFLKVARKYRTNVDMVIYQNEWQDWSRLTRDYKTLIFNNLMTNIVNLVNIELTDIFSLIKPYISFGGSSVPTIADGVTLYFKGYPEDNDSKYLLVKFIKELRKNLKTANKHFYLNIMLHMDELGKGVYDIEVLKQIIPSIDKREEDYEDKNYVDHYLVFIGEPTTKTKKDLRTKVEKLFDDGQQRSNMLQKISDNRTDRF